MLGTVSDRRILLAATFLRALATGMIAVLLGIHLAALGFDPTRIGIVIGAGLFGGAVATLFATLRADRFGRRRLLAAVALLSAGGGLLLAFGSHFAVALAAAFVGMVNGMGRDRGASLVVEQAILPATTGAASRTRAFAWYNVCQDAGRALGGLCAGLPVLLRRAGGVDEVMSLRIGLAAPALLFAIAAFLYMRLSPGVEAEPERARPRLSPESRRVVRRISLLFSLDSLAGGFLTTALLAFFFHRRFGAGEDVVGALFFGAGAANALSHLGAAWLAKRIGLVNTMVFTHIPSSLLLVTVAFAPTFPIAAALFLVREGLVEMDVPTRQSYVMGVVRPEERTIASGVTHLVRMAAWSVAPSFAGLFMQGLSLATPLFCGAGMKIAYDLLLYRAFRGLRPPEESAEAASAGATAKGTP
jgi:MFS family permease